MPIGNGGIIGPNNVPSLTSAKGVWSIQEAMLAQRAGTWPLPTPDNVDPYFYSVTSLLHGDGTNGGQNNTFLDSSTNNFTITRNGNTTQGSFSPFSQTGWSGYFDGNGDFLTFTNQGTTTAFTCECWFYRGEDVGGYHIIFGGSNASNVNPNNVQFPVYNNGSVALVLGGSAVISASGTNAAKNQWNHIAWVRSGTSCAIFVNGVRVGTGTSSAALNVDRIGTAGGLSAGTYDARGYISNARITTTAVYDPSLTTCTVPTAPLTAVTGTYLLTLQSNRFVDNSASPLTITRNGDVSVQPFSPFNPTTAYSTGAVGGSGYFDGSGDYLTLGNQSNLDGFTGDFCIESWIYPTGPITGTDQNFITKWTTGARSYRMYLTNTNNYLAIRFNNDTLNVISSTAVTLNCWSHVAAVRSSGVITLYLNGVSVASASSSVTIGSTTAGVLIGASESASPQSNFFGYMSDSRIVKGSPVYTTAFTPPTAPLTAITNTQLLLNFTNGAIFDNAAVADYETVGNAQISTSVKKYGTGSISFDGTGDYLLTDPPSAQLMAFGTGDFTVEMWVYFNAIGTNVYHFYDSRPASTDGAYPTLRTNASAQIEYVANSAVRITGLTLTTNTWYHVALCRTASQTKLFVNGTQTGSTYADTTNYLNAAARPLIGGSGFHVTTLSLNGYVDDVRISKGVARYPYNFTPPTMELPNIGGTVTLTADPYYDYTTLLLPGNGTNGAQNNTFLDSSTNNFTITRNGNTTQGTFSPFSQTGWGNFFDGSGDYLTAPSNAAFDFGTGDFTLEAWGYRTSSGAYGFLISRRAADVNYGPFSMGLDGSNAPYFACSSSGSSWIFVLTGSALPLNSWFHLAGVRNGNTFALYVNGTSVGTATSSASLMASSVAACIGAHANGSEPFAGYISNARIVKGTAVYTANFTPSTTPLTAITNTQLLTCQSNRFIDNSTNNFAITRNGDVSVQAFSPFNPTAAWSAATNGGSGYFDGSGDFLSVANSALLNLASTFSLEFWIYRTASNNQIFVSRGGGAANWSLTDGLQYGCFIESSTFYFQFNSGGSPVSLFATATLPPLNAWSHVAIARNGTTMRGWLNGVSLGTSTSTPSIPTTTNLTYLGNGVQTTLPFTGYMAGVRLIQGSSAYDASSSTITVPTAPVEAITNTSLLCNFTNAGIYDATSKNDLETVGNAQISTTQSKFGGSSMYFDGTDDRLLVPTSPNLTFGTGDFTIEAWVNRSTSGSVIHFIDFRGSNNDGSNPVFYWQTNNFIYYTNSNTTGDNQIQTSNAITSSSGWVHLAIVRFGTTLTVYVNGIASGSTTYSTNVLGGNPVTIANRFNNSGAYTGYIDDLRVTKGIARYTSNFTPPTTAFLTL